MVQTRRATGFASAYPLFSALAKQDSGRVAALITQQPDLAAACAPGSLSTLHFCVLMKDTTSIPTLAAAGAPLDGKLTLRFKSPELAKWFNTALQEAPSLAHMSRSEAWYGSGATPLSLALQLGQEAAAKALIDAGCNIWPLVVPYAQNYGPLNAHYLPPYIRSWLLPYLLKRFEEGQLAVSNEQLGILARLTLAAGQQGKCESVLRTAAGRLQPRLMPSDGPRLLACAVELGAVGLLQVLLELGASPTSMEPSTHKPIAVFAAEKGQGNAMAALLEAGAPITPQLVRAVLNKLQPQLLRILLAQGPIPIDSAMMSGGCWTCPVLNLLQIKPTYIQLPLVLQMAEVLASAGYKPTVYAGHDPLQSQPERTFELSFSNRYTLLPFQKEGWSPRVHHKYPPAFHSAVRTVLLCAARGARRHTELGSQEERGLHVAALKRLGTLPQELIMRILHSAAQPVSIWVC